jgi:hypothetical protein
MPGGSGAGILTGRRSTFSLIAPRTEEQPKNNRRTIEEPSGHHDQGEAWWPFWRLRRTLARPAHPSTYMTRTGMYARDDAAMERYELARAIHHERIRALEIELHRRRLLQPIDDVARPTSERQTSATRPTATRPTATRPTAAQPAGSPRRSSPLTR